MYRYSVDNAVTYSSEDFVLFRESPFACWMERLTLENPDHGIPADAGGIPPRDLTRRQDDIADTLRDEGKLVSLIEWDDDEPARRAATLDAMRRGADFIVNGQLALGPLSSPVNLLMRTSGYSELGDYLYIPCDTQAATSPHAAFRLCFLADLLHSLQGQLPPQILIIRGGDDLVPLQTEEHIYHYRAVKQRFMAEMRNFRKHRMPDPAESSHFGRWSDCAHEVLKQRLLGEERREEESGIGEPTEAPAGGDYAEPLRKAVGATVSESPSPYDMDDVKPQAVAASSGSLTLAEQARMLAPGTYKPGPGVHRYRTFAGASGQFSNAVPTHDRRRAVPEAKRSGDSAHVPASAPGAAHDRRSSDPALQNLAFIGSSQQTPRIGDKAAAEASPVQAGTVAQPEVLAQPETMVEPDTFGEPDTFAEADSFEEANSFEEQDSFAEADTFEEANAFEARNRFSLEPDARPAPAPTLTPAASTAPGPSLGDSAATFSRSAVDLDSNHPAVPTPVLSTAEADLRTEYSDGSAPLWTTLDDVVTTAWERESPSLFSDSLPDLDTIDDLKASRFDQFSAQDKRDVAKTPRETASPQKTFSDSLITSPDYDT